MMPPRRPATDLPPDWWCEGQEDLLDLLDRLDPDEESEVGAS